MQPGVSMGGADTKRQYRRDHFASDGGNTYESRRTNSTTQQIIILRLGLGFVGHGYENSNHKIRELHVWVPSWLTATNRENLAGPPKRVGRPVSAGRGVAKRLGITRACDLLKLRALAKSDVAPTCAGRVAPRDLVHMPGRRHRIIAIRGSRPRCSHVSNPAMSFVPVPILCLYRHRARRVRPRSSTWRSFYAALHCMAYLVGVRACQPRAVSNAISFSGTPCRAPERRSGG